jgi:hypothetical protein
MSEIVLCMNQIPITLVNESNFQSIGFVYYDNYDELKKSIKQNQELEMK